MARSFPTLPLVIAALIASLSACGRPAEPYDPHSLAGQIPDVVEALANGDPESALALIAERRRLGTAPEGIDHFEGVALADAGRPADAAEVLTREVEARPGNGLASLLLAEALAELGRLELARPHLEEARRLLKDTPYVELVAARLALAADDDAAASRAYAAYLASDRTSARAAEAHHGLAQLARAAGQIEAAEAHEERSAHLERVHQYLNAYQQRLADDPDDSDAALGVGMTYLDLYQHVSGEPRFLLDAEQAFRACLVGDPTNVRALYNLGFVALAGGRAEEAQSAWSQAISLQPEHVGSLLNSGTLAARTGELDLAAKRLEQALEYTRSAEDSLRAHVELARVLERMGLADRAAEHFAAAAEIDPSRSWEGQAPDAGKPDAGVSEG